MAKTVKVEVTLDDAPQKPAELATGETKNLWDTFRESTKDFTPEKLMEAVTSARRQIMEKAEERGSITEEEAKLMNKTTGENLKKTLDEYYEKAMGPLQVTPKDNPKTIELKTGFVDQLGKWLTKLFDWVLGKIKEIFNWIKEKLITWCIEQAGKLFARLVAALV